VWYDRHFIVDVNDGVGIASISERAIADAIRHIRGVLKHSGIQHMVHDELEAYLTEALPYASRGIKAYIKSRLLERFQVAVDPRDRIEYIVAFDNNLTDIIYAVLAGSDSPLSVEQIHQRITNSGYDYSENSIAGLAKSVAIPMGERVYGLRHHIHVTDEEIDDLLQAIEAIVATKPSYQWHIDEIRNGLRWRYGIEQLPIDGYTLMYFIGQSPVLISKGYYSLAWRNAEDPDDVQRRVKLREVIEAILVEEGAPLDVIEVRRRLRQRRGIADYQQIFTNGRVVHLGRRRVGLLDRDTMITESDIHELRRLLTQAVLDEGLNLHSNEAVTYVQHRIGGVFAECDEYLIRDILQRVRRTIIDDEG
jgi:hypothetical protein